MSNATVDTARPAGLDANGPMALLPLLTKAAIGVRQPDGQIRIGQGEPRGYVLRGPLCELPAGDYVLRVRCKTGASLVRSQPVLGVEILALGHALLVWRDFTAEELKAGTATIGFAVTPDIGRADNDAIKFDFRFYHFGNASLEISGVDLVPAVRGAAPAADRSRYRLLPRMRIKRARVQIRRRAQRDPGERVSISRHSLSRMFLDGPDIHFRPQWHYGLSVKGRAGPAKDLNAPVIGVEVIACGAQQAHRDFTAAELNTGAATFDFRPADFALAENPSLSFRLYHFGNADVDIDAVDLVSGEPTGRWDNPRSWRLSGRLWNPSRWIGITYAALARMVPGLPLMFGIAPRLFLAIGRYRLSFDVRGDFPETGSGPLVDVTVLAKGTWRPPRQLELLFDLLRWRLRAKMGDIANFRVTAAQLRNGRVALDFEASADWSLDGERVLVDLKFFNRARGVAAVENVVLEGLPEYEAGEAGGVGAPAVSSGRARTRVVTFGNCQAQVYANVLRHEASADLAISYQFIVLRPQSAERYRRELERADVVLAQDLADWETYPLREHVRDTTQVLKFPHLRLASLWPFDHYNGPGDPQAAQKDWPDQKFAYLDGLLARLRNETPDPQRRFERYASLEVELLADPVRLHRFEMRRLAAMDKRYGVRVGEFIADNVQKRRLFHTTSHPTGEVFALLLDHLLQQLGHKPLRTDGKVFDHYFHLVQVPVHPGIARMLGIAWADERTLYRWGPELLTWEAYVRRYISYYG